MRTLDLSPLFRSSVGFDRINQMFESALRIDEAAPSYPPYNIERRGENQYRITMAVAGFEEQDLSVSTQDNILVIRGSGRKVEESETPVMLHRGIAKRSFDRRFQLADHIRVAAAHLEHGLLHVDLLREVPEALKPREIKINALQCQSQPAIEQKLDD